MNIPKTGIRGANSEKVSIVKISPELRQRLDDLVSEGHSEADIIREALNKLLPKKKSTKEVSQ